MNEPAITAEDLTLYALQSLDGAAASRVELLLRSSSEARQELSKIWGDLAAVGCGAPQHTPPALSRQRLLKQVAREPRALPIPMAAEEQQFAIDAPDVQDPRAAGADQGRFTRLTAEERRARVRVPRIVGEPEPMFAAQAEESAGLPIQPAPESTDRAHPPAAPLDAKQNARRLTEARDDRPSRTEPHSRPFPVQAPAPEPEQDDVHFVRSSNREPVTIFPALAAADPMLAADAEDRYEPSSRRSFLEDDSPGVRSRGAVVLGWAGWVAAAGMAAALLSFVRTNDSLQGRLHAQTAALARTQASAARADLVLQTLESGSSQRFVLARQDTAPIPSARVAYLADRGSVVLQGTNLEALPPYKTYELWLIPAGEGRQPIPAGTFKPDARGYATLVMPSLPKGTVAANFGVTIEDETGSTVPTLPILLVGQG